MDTVTRIIAKFWSFVISIFGNAAEKSNNPESADFTRAIIIGIRIAGRLCRCEIVPHLPEKGRFHCAILWRNGSQSLKPRTLQQIAEFIARDYFRRSPDSVGWIYIPQRSGAKPVIPEDVLELQFTPRGTDGDFRCAWSEAAPEIAREWIDRTAATREFGRHILVR